MIPQNFPEANTVFGKPPDLEESQCFSIPAYVGKIASGNLDGASVVIVVWKPTEHELAVLNLGGAVYLSTLSGLLPHYLSTSFDEAKNL